MWLTLFVRRVIAVTCFLLLSLVACAPARETVNPATRPRAGATSVPAATFTPATVSSPVAHATATASSTPEPPTSTPTALPAQTPTAVPSATAAATRTPSSWVSAVNAVTIYSGPGREYTPAGTLEAGASAGVTDDSQGDWLNILCPDGIAGSCWIVWDWNSLYLYEGTPIALDIPDPASLNIESSRSVTSPDGRWQAQSTRSESVSFISEESWHFYVELKVTSLEDGTTWTPVSEWHGAGLGEEDAPNPFYWSKDGRFLYYTSIAYPDGACAFYDNIGDYLDRLDLTNGSVAALQPPYARGILTISPDEQLLAYLSDGSLVVRELATAYDGGSGTGQDSVKWQVPLDGVGPGQVSKIAWTPDSRQVSVKVTQLADNCQLASQSTWELDVETGAFTALPVICPQLEAAGGVARQRFLIFCGGADHVDVAYNDSLIIDGALTAEAYVNYFGGGGEGPRVIEIIDTFYISYSEGQVWFCLFSQGFASNQGNGWHCLSQPQPELNRWVHLAGSWDGVKMYLFMDGELKVETAFPGPLFHGGPGSFKIGNGWMLYDGFNGLIDEVRLSSIGRYQASFEPQSQFVPDEYTVGLWHFDDGQGTAAADAGGYGNHGVLSPGVKWGSQP